VQHALRAFTPRDQKAVKATARTFRQNPKIDTATVITQLNIGEALVSMLEGNGVPSIVQRTLIAPPMAQVGPITPDQRAALMAQSPVRGKNDIAIDNESAYEILQKRRQMAEAPAQQASQSGGIGGVLGSVLGGLSGPRTTASGRPSNRMSTGELIVRNVVAGAARTVGNTIARDLIRGVLGGFTRN